LDGGASADWNCQNLQCTCRSGATFCGAVPVSNLTKTINSLSGTLEISCGVVDNSTNTATCQFKQAVLNSLFGTSGLTLDGCSFGECIRQSVIDGGGGNTTTSGTASGGKPLSGGVVAGLAVVGCLVFFALSLLVFGLVRQKAARRVRSEDTGGIKMNIEWTGVSYSIPSSNASSILPRLRRRKRTLGNNGDEKVILDSVSGSVKAGQIMAILGPSGTLSYPRCISYSLTVW
jgi:ABC-type multidrug transport system fused ATPase/permease subunit